MCAAKRIKFFKEQGAHALAQGRTFEAIQTLNDGLKCAKELRSPMIEATFRTNLGVAFMQSGLPDTAVANFKHALRLVDGKVGSRNKLFKAIRKNLDEALLAKQAKDTKNAEQAA